MCDYDYEYTVIAFREVTTRKKHDCNSCDQSFPAGTKMVVAVGKQEGEMVRTYSCAACRFMHSQQDETIMHLCWGWGYETYYEDEIGFAKQRWQYVHDTLAAGSTPTIEGAGVAIAAAREAERIEMEA